MVFFSMLFKLGYEERILPYLNQNISSDPLWLVGEGGNSVRLDPTVMGLLLPHTKEFGIIMIPEAPTNSIIEVCNLLYTGR